MEEFHLQLTPSPRKGKFRTQRRSKRPKHYFYGSRPGIVTSSFIEETGTTNEEISVSAKKMRLAMPDVSSDMSDVLEGSDESVSEGCLSKSDISGVEEFSDDECVSECNYDGYRIIHLSSLVESLESIAVCKDCSGPLAITQNKPEGITTPLTISCATCNADANVSVPFAGESRVKELNLRSMLAARFIGKNYAGLRKFLSILGLPVSLSKTTYSKYADRLHDAIVAEATESMKIAAEELRRHVSESQPDDVKNVAVTCDGTWAKRGFTSLHGVVVVISLMTGQVLDFECLSKSCDGCRSWERKKGTPKYEAWLQQHSEECKINFDGSSGAMESEGALKMFRRSIEKHKLRYTTLIGDGDSKTHKAICDEKIYEVNKLECVGHIQKRMGTGLRKLKKEKKLGGKGKLTDVLIDSMQTYYGKAIRENKGCVEDMQKATLAIIYHKMSTDEKPQHQYCPNNSWCKYKTHSGPKPFEHKKPLPEAIGKAIMPLFERLSDISLLEKCAGGYTQNQNEALNNLIWTFCPKTGYAGSITVETSVALAVCIFNNGYTALDRIVQHLGVSSDEHFTKFISHLDKERIKFAEKKSSNDKKSARKRRRQQRKKKEDKTKSKEGETYVSGGF